MDLLALSIWELDKIELKPNELKHRGVHRSRVFLEKVAHHKLPIKSEKWKEYKCLGEIRNLIIHNDGHLGNDKELISEEILKYINKQNGIKISDSNAILLYEEFITQSEILMLNIHQSICDYFLALDDFHEKVEL